jgi:hypothetical protein
MGLFKKKLKPTVTTEDKIWVEESIWWLEEQYGKSFLINQPFFTPTRQYFDHTFRGNEEDAYFVLEQLCVYMDIKDVNIALTFYSESPQEFSDEGIEITQSENLSKSETNFALGRYSQDGMNKYEIGIDFSVLKDPQVLIATMAHELSHLILLGEGRIDENDEFLTDLNAIAMGFGIFTANSIFSFSQWQGLSFHGWQANRRGYLPEQVVSYALALLQCYKKKEDDWSNFLNPGIKKQYDKNMNYLKENKEGIGFLNA